MVRQPIGPINAATPTPLKPDGTLDRASALRLCRRWLDIDLDGVFLLGSMGEGPYLPEGVRDAFLELALDQVGGKLALFASVADLSRERMHDRAVRYARMGVDRVILLAPPGSDPAKAVADVKWLADACSVPCGYYEVPTNTNVALTIAQIIEILTHENITVFKDSSNNPLLAQHMASEAVRSTSVVALDGSEFRTAFSAALGYDGVLHGGAVLTARRVRRIWEAALRGLLEEAIRLDRENSLFLASVYDRVISRSRAIIGQKYALKLLEVFDHEHVVLDQYLDEAAQKRIVETVEANRNWLAASGDSLHS
ncbi:MAG: dihydrodipicolinate synthase family protein [Limnochordia bacterium]|jgi:4-hydroxy-tetrahydrodipicolinate synthase